MTATEIKEKLSTSLTPDHIEVMDESPLHAGHQGGGNSENSHFRVLVVSTQFEGMSLVDRHRKVYSVIGMGEGADIHALALQTLTPSEAKSRGF